jgi:hypothetical protein
MNFNFILISNQKCQRQKKFFREFRCTFCVKMNFIYA